MKSFIVIPVALFTACILSAQTESPKPKLFGSATAAPNAQQPPPPISSASHESSGETVKPPVEKNRPPLDASDRDLSVKPQEDFFIYANGGWIKQTQIPPEYSRWEIGRASCRERV